MPDEQNSNREARYLAIRNWEKYQTKLDPGQRRQWIKLFLQVDDDEEFIRLTMFQRALLLGLWRLRGRTHRNVPYDAGHISMALGIIPEERRAVPYAIEVLIRRRFLVPCCGPNGNGRCTSDTPPIGDRYASDSKISPSESTRVSDKSKSKNIESTTTTTAAASLQPHSFTGAYQIFWQGQILAVSTQVHTGLGKAFPSFNREELYAQADVWLVTHPEKPKKDHAVFIDKWFREEKMRRYGQNGGNGHGPPKSVRPRIDRHTFTWPKGNSL